MKTFLKNHIISLSIAASLLSIILIIYDVMKHDIDSNAANDSSKIDLRNIVKANGLSYESNNFTWNINSDDLTFEINKYLVKEYGINDILFNNESILKQNAFNSNEFTYTDNTITTRLKYKLKPSLNKLIFELDNGKYEYDVRSVYNGVDFNTPEWEINDNVLLTNNNDNSLYFNRKNGRIVAKIKYTRKFTNSAEVQLFFSPKYKPLNLSVFASLGTTYYFGMNDNKSIQIIQTKVKDTGENYNKIVYMKFMNKGFVHGNKYKITTSSNDNVYKFEIYDTTNNKVLFDDTYIDQDPSKTIGGKQKIVEIGCWENGGGINLYNINISSNDRM